jgi:hypothetical protein
VISEGYIARHDSKWHKTMDLNLADFNRAVEAYLKVSDKNSAGHVWQRFQSNKSDDGYCQCQRA